MARFTHEQMKKMTRRMASEQSHCQAEFLAFVGAMAKAEWQAEKCPREYRDVLKCVGTIRKYKQKPTLNYHVQMAMKGKAKF
jgi:hypothetical protein